jgi:protein-S-isoprenylcysteine O-methyltransferase Ste14
VTSTDLLVLVANVACWGTVLAVWIVVAVRDAGLPHAPRVRGAVQPGETLVAIAAIAGLVFFGRRLLMPFVVDAPWVRLVGVVVLVASTAFAVWARLTLGRSWSINPRAAAQDGLRTDGPYAITRHPIYTGMLGMLLGTVLLAGLGQWIVIVLAGLVGIELKIRSEERLLLATFPDAYRAYRERVPQLIPGWHRRLPATS